MDTSPSAPKDFFAADLDLPDIESNVDDLPAGFRLGSYVLQECIGRGAMATVYRAQHSLLKNAVAVKLMKRTLLTSSEARHRFFREARAAAAIKHPNVVRITDAGTVNSVPYLVMELLEGIDLEQHMRERAALDEPELIALALPIVAALAVAHDAGIVHRDLKPANIFMAREAVNLVPKLLDFGVSKFSEDVITDDMVATRFDQLMGSPLYVAPEGINGVRQLTGRSDQYSFGVILYECATGTPPFTQQSLLQLLNAIAEGQFVAPSFARPSISAGLEHVILRAMSVDPAARFSDMRALGRALMDLADTGTVIRWAPTFDYEPPTQRPLTPSVLPSAAAPGIALIAAPKAYTLSAPANTTDLVAVVEPQAPNALVRRRRPRRVSSARTLFLGLTGIVLLAYSASQINASPSAAHGARPVEVEGHALLPVTGSTAAGAADPTGGAGDRATARTPLDAPLLEAPPLLRAPPVAIAADETVASVTTAPSASEPASPARAPRFTRKADSREHVRQLFLPPREAKGSPPAATPELEAPMGVANEAPILD